jgi:hypothetical protein
MSRRNKNSGTLSRIIILLLLVGIATGAVLYLLGFFDSNNIQETDITSEPLLPPTMELEAATDIMPNDFTGLNDNGTVIWPPKVNSADDSDALQLVQIPENIEFDSSAERVVKIYNYDRKNIEELLYYNKIDKNGNDLEQVLGAYIIYVSPKALGANYPRVVMRVQSKKLPALEYSKVDLDIWYILSYQGYNIHNKEDKMGPVLGYNLKSIISESLGDYSVDLHKEYAVFKDNSVFDVKSVAGSMTANIPLRFREVEMNIADIGKGVLIDENKYVAVTHYQNNMLNLGYSDNIHVTAYDKDGNAVNSNKEHIVSNKGSNIAELHYATEISKVKFDIVDNFEPFAFKFVLGEGYK